MKIPDEKWEMGKISYELRHRRYKTKTIVYAESHD